MVTISDYFGEGDLSELQSRVLIEDDIPVIEFWKDKKLVAVKGYPDHPLSDVEEFAEDYVLGYLTI